jgi:probable F420-dependent oxidoreductase
MTKQRRLGFFLSPAKQEENTFERALWADEQGYDDIWFPDGYGTADAMTLASAVAARTTRARLATGVTPVFTRVPAILATSTLAINSVAPGRFVLGLGSSTHAMVDGWYGETFAKPLTRMRETVALVRTMLAGAKTDFDGKTIRSHGFRLNAPIEGDIPIFLGAMGPKMLELVGEVADGVVLNHFTPMERMPFALECLDRGAKRAGRRVDDIEIAARICVRVTEDDAQALHSFATDFTFYSSTEIYRNIVTLLGYGDAAKEIAEGFKQRDRQRIMAAAPEELVRQLYVWGDRAHCQARINALFDAGVDTVIVAPQTDNHPDWVSTCEAFTPSAFARG